MLHRHAFSDIFHNLDLKKVETAMHEIKKQNRRDRREKFHYIKM